MNTRAPLSRDRILVTALRLVDNEGLAALSMRRLGQELGVEAMSLYHHVPNKAALLSGIVELLLGRLEVPPASVGDWQARVRALARSFRRLAHDHPNAFPLIVTHELKTPKVVRLLDAMLDICRDAGCAEEEALDAFCALAGFVSGAALFEIGGYLSLVSDETWCRASCNGANGQGLAGDRPVSAGDAQFEFGLDVILTGLAAKLALSPNGRTQRAPASVAER